MWRSNPWLFVDHVTDAPKSETDQLNQDKLQGRGCKVPTIKEFGKSRGVVIMWRLLCATCDQKVILKVSSKQRGGRSEGLKERIHKSMRNFLIPCLFIILNI